MLVLHLRYVLLYFNMLLLFEFFEHKFPFLDLIFLLLLDLCLKFFTFSQHGVFEIL